MIKVCKIRIYPNSTQLHTIHKILNACRYIKNQYIAINVEAYKNGCGFISGYDFSKMVNDIKHNVEEYEWLEKVSSKAIKDAIMNEESCFKGFFKKTKGFPRFHSKKRTDRESYFFIKDHIHYTDNPNIIKLPILGRVRITEGDYLPDIKSITSGRIVREYDKFYVVFIYETQCKCMETTSTRLGIDVGVKNYASISTNDDNFITVSHFKDDEKYKGIGNKIIKLQQTISHKIEINYKRKLEQYKSNHNGEEPNDKYKNIMKGESYKTSQIRRLFRKIRNLKSILSNIRRDFINKLVNMLTAITKPNTITIENLSVTEMTRHNGTKDTVLHRYIQESGFYMFKTKLINKCMEYGITLRIADKYFASSKTCSYCGSKKKSLSLNDRFFVCDECGIIMDRDLNASINLLNLKDKKCLVYKFA